MRVATYATRNFATLGLLELQPPFTGPSIQCILHLLLSFRHRAGVRPYTSRLRFAESCVFNKQLPPPICWKKRPGLLFSLFPKVREKFAEFLHYGSLKRLRLLDVFTSVGLQYGCVRILSRKKGFSRKTLFSSSFFSHQFLHSQRILGAVSLCVDMRSAETFELSAIMVFS